MQRNGGPGAAALKLPRAIAIGAVVSALLVAGYWWLRQPGPRPESRAPTAAGALPRPLPSPSPPAAPVSAPAASPVPAALTHAFHDVPLPRALIGRLAAGEVAQVAAALERAGDAASAVQLGDLAALCASAAAAADPATEGSEAHASLIAGSAGPDARAVIDSAVAAAYAWRARARPGCAAAALDPARIRARLEAAAAKGDATSLERLAEQDALPLVRLQGAALLGSARAQYRVALAIVATQPFAARSWLNAAASRNADAAAFHAECLLSGCFGPPDAAAARAEFEAAARDGALFALGTLSSSEAAGGPRRWARFDAPLVPSAPGGPEALGLDPASAFAWTAFSAALARAGCFGFDYLPAAEALEGEARFERSLRPSELEAARQAAATLEASSGAATRRALGCDAGAAR